MKKILLISTLLSLIFCGRVEEHGIFGESRKKDVLGQDGVTSIPLTDSITMWTFGDTILGTWKGNVSASATFSESVNITDMIPNSLAFTETPTSKNVGNLRFIFFKEKGKVCQFIKYKKDEKPGQLRLWAVDGITIGNRVYVYYYIIKINSKKIPGGFKLDAIGIAAWDIPNNWKPGQKVNFKRLPDVFPSDYPAFGATVLKRKGYVYTAGHYAAGDHSSPIKIARAKIHDIRNPAAYEFLTKDGKWVKHIDKAEPFLGDVMGECSISYNKRLRKYVIIYCRQWTGKIVMVAFNDFDELIKARKKIIYEPPKLIQNDKKPVWYYSGKEIFSSKNSIFMIYIHPLEYQPYLLKINL